MSLCHVLDICVNIKYDMESKSKSSQMLERIVNIQTGGGALAILHPFVLRPFF